ncbi:Protein of unknown function [Gryllus bimaculatus]|nr:Protein of unknown function [Gryllus bimaculatus]
MEPAQSVTNLSSTCPYAGGKKRRFHPFRGLRRMFRRKVRAAGTAELAAGSGGGGGAGGAGGGGGGGAADAHRKYRRYPHRDDTDRQGDCNRLKENNLGSSSVLPPEVVPMGSDLTHRPPSGS